MPRRIVLGYRHALTLDRVADDGARPLGRRRRSVAEDLPQRIDIVAVALEHTKAEARPLVDQRLHALDIEYTAGRLDLVVVDDGRQIGQAMLISTGGRLPDRAFIDLAVAHQHVDLAVTAAHARRQRHAEPDRKSVAQCARASLNTGHDRLGMAAEKGIEAAEAVELFHRKEAAIRKHSVERQAAVTLAENEAITLTPTRLLRPVAQEVVIKHTDDFNQ